MATASINVKAVTSTSEIHNTRAQSLSYVIEERIKLNESWPAIEDRQSIADREKEVRSLCKKLSGRKMRSSATPIREAVVNLGEETTMDDLLNLKDVLKEKFKVECFQIHIHRDEGRLVDEKGKTQYTKVKGGWKSPEGKIIKDPTEQNPNLQFKENKHAHMVFDWQNKDTGKMIRHGKGIMSQMQTETAKALKMDRGELKTNSNRERLEAIEYKREQEQIRFNELQQQIKQLEQKKNAAAERNREARQQHDDALESHTEALIRSRKLEEEAREIKEAQISLSRERTKQLAKKGIQMDKEALYEASNELSRAIELQRQFLHHQQQEIDRLEGESQEWEDKIGELEQTIDRTEGNIEYVQQKEERTRKEIERAKARIEANKK